MLFSMLVPRDDFIVFLLIVSYRTTLFFRLPKKKDLLLSDSSNHNFDTYLHDRDSRGQFFSDDQHLDCCCYWLVCEYLYNNYTILRLLPNGNSGWFRHRFHFFDGVHNISLFEFGRFTLCDNCCIWIVSSLHYYVVEASCLHRLQLFVCLSCNGSIFGLLRRKLFHSEVYRVESILQPNS